MFRGGARWGVVYHRSGCAIIGNVLEMMGRARAARRCGILPRARGNDEEISAEIAGGAISLRAPRRRADACLSRRNVPFSPAVNDNSAASLAAMLRSERPVSAGAKLALVIRMSVPAMMAEFAHMAMSCIDAAMIGRLGTEGAAAVGLAASSTWFFGGEPGRNLKAR